MITYLITGKIVCTMFDYLEEMIEECIKNLKIFVFTCQETTNYLRRFKIRPGFNKRIQNHPAFMLQGCFLHIRG